ncbi:hypothetical protein SLEP1_g35922 [Rubroshorea leprosula]|uniref:K Homology domain-containing protein n=1 Tax=Rubroshorea leprosula TaxID=152421 RepID=A0AAV5KPY3_9ROSI|nr:hypothetical protein SLEP1_g35922 [Rubroshorea leprosula]
MGSTFLSIPAKRAMPDPNPTSLNGLSKRSKPSHPLPSVPPGHVSFRLLCHASRVGGVIGKAGTVIKQLQQSTGAKIRIEEAPPECQDRVITVTGPSAVNTKLVLNSGGFGSGGSGSRSGGNGQDEEVKVSKGQDALIRVFERILEVAAESNGVAVGVVSCRLLVEASQAGSVIGKGGKIVEKIKKETGSKIRVLTDNLPACAAATEEMVELEGDVLSVKKALVAVSRCLQDCPSSKTRITESRTTETVPQETLHRHIDVIPQDTLQRHIEVLPFETLCRPVEAVPQGILHRPIHSVTHETLRRHTEAAPQGNLPDVLIDRLSQHSSLGPSLSSSSISSRVYPLSLESEKAQQELTFKILCSNEKVGGVIGRGGAIIKSLQSETGASITIGALIADCDERLITVTASENPESRYSPAQKAAVLVFVKALESGIEKGLDSGSKGSTVTARLVVPSNQVGCLLGKGGIIITEMRKVTGAGIRVLGADQVPKCIKESDQVVQISGEYMNVKDAIYHVTGRLRDNLFSSTLKGGGARSTSTVFAETSPCGRLMDSEPLGLHSPGGVSHNLGQRTTIAHSLDHLELSHGLDCSLDCSLSPKPWAPETITIANPRAIAEVGRGLTSFRGGLELGSGSKSAIVTNTTVEIRVPENVIGSVYGENGRNLLRLREISGAKVIVHEPRLGTSDRIIVISGTPDETQAAQSLLQAFILTGPSR